MKCNNNIVESDLTITRVDIVTGHWHIRNDVTYAHREIPI